MSVAISGIVQHWTSIYSNSAPLRTVVTFLHVGGLIVAGGTAIVADRATLTAARRGGDRTASLTAVRDAHRVVLAGLAIVLISGVLLFAADLDTFLRSRFFWMKMGLILLLAGNGAVLQRAERRASMGDERAWPVLTRTAKLSLVLWFVITAAGSALPNIG